MLKVLIIRFSALGDCAMLVPVVRELAVSYPSSEITVLSGDAYSELWSDIAPNIRFVGAAFRGRHQGLRGLHLLLSELGTDYDVVLDMHDVWRSLYLRFRFFIAGKRVLRLKKGRVGRWLLTHGFCRQPLVAMWRRYAECADSVLRMSLEEPRLVQQREQCCEGIGIAPFAAHSGKQYPIEKMEVVVRELSREHYHIILFGGGEKERAVLQRWSEEYEGVESVADSGLGLKEEISLMRGLRLMVTMDSANMHLASLAGTRVVSIWGSTHPYAGFLGIGQDQRDCLQLDLPCRPCSVYGKTQCRYHDYRCLNIAPQVIIDKVKTSYAE